MSPNTFNGVCVSIIFAKIFGLVLVFRTFAVVSHHSRRLRLLKYLKFSVNTSRQRSLSFSFRSFAVTTVPSQISIPSTVGHLQDAQ